MSDFKRTVETQANALETQHAQQGRIDNATQFAELLQQSQEARRRAEEGFESIHSEETRRQKQSVLKWLSPADTTSDQEYYRECRGGPDSGKWLLMHRRFKAWLDPTSDSAPLLWVTGMPGAGKHLAVASIRPVADLARREVCTCILHG